MYKRKTIAKGGNPQTHSKAGEQELAVAHRGLFGPKETPRPVFIFIAKY